LTPPHQTDNSAHSATREACRGVRFDAATSTSSRSATRAPFPRAHVRFDVASQTSTYTSSPNRIPMAPPPLRVRPTPLPSVTTRTPIVLVESETDSDSSLSPGVMFFSDLIDI
jgi:hypothetical protein